MAAIVRIYATEDAARNASANLARAGFADNKALLPSELTGREANAVRSAVRDGILPGSNTAVCTRLLQEGRSLVAVDAVFGRGNEALKIMADAGAVDTYLVPDPPVRNAAPFSEVFGWPVLSSAKPSTELVDSKWRFSSLFGLGLLGGGAAPLSSMIAFPTLTGSKSGKRSSMGLPLLMNSASPLSSMLGLPTVLKPKRPWKRSMGFGMLSDNATPLSSFIGISALSDESNKK